MRVVILCGGKYSQFKKHKALTEINGEVLVERTIRLLEENGVNNWWISSNDKDFEKYKKIIRHHNSYEFREGKVYGYWLDAYGVVDKPTIFLHGDVYYSENAIKKILNLNPKVNTFIGNEIARNPEHLNWGEPFGWVVVNPAEFNIGIEKTKELQDKGLLERGYAISWELYRVLNNLDPNKQYINDNTYLSIDDETIDIDEPYQIEELNRRIKNL